MTLTPGTRIGPYEIVSPLGAGGMGEVYRASDHHLKRSVAIKVLPAAMASDADRLARFQREAEVLASLNHPNIAQIYGIEERTSEVVSTFEGKDTTSEVVFRALVMELVEGQDLSEMIAGRDPLSSSANGAPPPFARPAPFGRSSGRAEQRRSPRAPHRASAGPQALGVSAIPLFDALAIARQIAAALEAAHDAGIIHRDLKPQNIKVRADGTVKVLDFGLAKAFGSAQARAMDPALQHAAPGTQHDGMAATMTSPAMTQMGMILGTAAYMAPEQAKGRAVDKRADIWAFGVVLYEMLTGRRLFDPSRASGSPRASSRGEGDSVVEVLAAVLQQDIDFSALPASTPPRLRALLARCLERDVTLRLRDIGEARIALSDPAALALTEVTAPAPTSALSRLLPWAAVALLTVVAAVTTWGWLHPPVAPARPTTRASMVLPKSVYANGLAVSRDGTRLAYWEMTEDGRRYIALRALDQLEARPIAGTEEGDFPAFSPDGEWIAFATPEGPRPQLKKIRMTGGAPVTLCDLDPKISFPFSITWDDADTIIFSSDTGLKRVPAAGGTPEVLTTVDTKAGEQRHAWAQVLPDGRGVIFSVTHGHAEPPALAVTDPKTGSHRILVKGARAGRYVPTGHLVFTRGDMLFAAPFDAARLAMTGPETPVVENISYYDYAFSQSGVLAFSPSDAVASSNMVRLEWMDRKGATQPLEAPAKDWFGAVVSPDGLSVVGGIARDIWKFDTVRATLTKLATGGDSAAWSRDGQWVSYRSIQAGKTAIYRVRADSSRAPELVVAGGEDFHVEPGPWAPDGSFTYLRSLKTPSVETNATWMLLPPPGTSGGQSPENPGRPLVGIGNEDIRGPWQISPDGKTMAYVVGDDDNEVFVTAFPGPGAKIQISANGGYLPKWSRDGRELFYIEGRWFEKALRLMSVNMATVPPGRPQLVATLPSRFFDVTPNANRFLVRKPQVQDSGSSIIVITNWFEDLLRQVPVKK